MEKGGGQDKVVPPREQAGGGDNGEEDLVGSHTPYLTVTRVVGEHGGEDGGGSDGSTNQASRAGTWWDHTHPT